MGKVLKHTDLSSEYPGPRADPDLTLFPVPEPGGGWPDAWHCISHDDEPPGERS